MGIKDQFKDIHIDLVAKSLGLGLQKHGDTPQDYLGSRKAWRLRGKKQGKRWYVRKKNLQAYYEEEPQEAG